MESSGRISSDEEGSEEEEDERHNNAAINDDQDEGDGEYAEISPSLQTKNEFFLQPEQKPTKKVINSVQTTNGNSMLDNSGGSLINSSADAQGS